MASIEKLMKAFEALKVVQTNFDKPEEAIVSTKFMKRETTLTKKDKIMYCNTITDIICSPSLRNIEDFHKFLGIAIETFLACCDDADSDIRMVANECLNRTIKNLLDSQLGRIQVELYKEIKKNGASRSLRVALSRFAGLVHLTRPAKCRPYVQNLFPCLAKISERAEDEPLQETLCIAMTKIMPVFGSFASDNEVITLVTKFLPNLQSPLASVRRTAATSLVVACQHSRKPHVFYSWLLSSLLQLVNCQNLKDLIISDQNYHDRVLIGIFLCLKHLMHQLYELPSFIEYESLRNFGLNQKHKESLAKDYDAITESLLQIYELILHNLRFNANHSVVMSALEALHLLLKYLPKFILPYLSDPQGIDKSRLGSIVKISTPVSPSLSTRKRRILSTSTINSVGCSSENVATLYDDNDEMDIKEIKLSNTKSYEDLREETKFDELDKVDVESEFGSLSSSADISLGKNIEEPTEQLLVNSNAAQVMKLTYVDSEEANFLEEQQVSPTTDSFDASDDKSTDVDIGEFTTKNISSLEYCARLLCYNFLLTGVPGCNKSDKNVRVSVKGLAFGCLVDIIKLHPKAFIIDLPAEDQIKNQVELSSTTNQKVWDIISFSIHPDPHLRGQVALVVGTFLKEVLTQPIRYNEFLLKNCSISAYPEAPALDELLEVLIKVVFDKQNSSVAIKHSLDGLKLCLNSLLETDDLINLTALRLIEQLIDLKNNNYWLVKVDLLELFSSLPFKTIFHLESSFLSSEIKKESIQQTIIREVFLFLVHDDDFRVRQAVSSAFIRIIPLMFTPAPHYNSDPISFKALEYTMTYMPGIFHVSLSDFFALNQNFLPPNFLLSFKKELSDPLIQDNENFQKFQKYLIEANLKVIIKLLVDHLKMNIDSKPSLIGCCLTLAQLSENFPVIEYLSSWGGESNDIASLEYLIKVMQSLISTNPNVVLDITVHQQILFLINNLLEGLSFYYFVKSNLTEESDLNYQDFNWSLLSKVAPDLVVYLEFMFNYQIKLLLICSNIIEETTTYSGANPTLSGSSVSVKSSVIPNFTNSPIKKKVLKTSELSDKFDEKSTKKNEIEKEKHGKNLSINPLLTRLYEFLRASYLSNKSSMELNNDKVSLLLKAILKGLSMLLEISTLKFISKYSEEMLNCFKTVITLEPAATVKVVRQLLKCIFGTNFAMIFTGESIFDFSQTSGSKQEKHSKLSFENYFNVFDSRFSGLYQCCIAAPYSYFTQFYASRSSSVSGSTSSEFDIITNTSVIRKKIEKKVSVILDKNNASQSSNNKATLTSHIRLFEPVVIKALKQYTATTDVDLQCEVLDLLSQLVQLRVNYCLLDSDQIFINYVLKQFEFIEGNQLNNFDKLIPHMFFFLVLLSYEKYHSKPIIGVPKIIQLCDGIIASGQKPELFAAPALKLLVEDLILHRSPRKVESTKELEAQREVVISNMLKLAQFPKILKLLCLVVQQARKDGDEKWKKISRQITDILLPLLMKQLIHIDDYNSQELLHGLFESVSPSVFRPVDILLTALFAAPQPAFLDNYFYFHRWISLILVILRILIVQFKEEVVLSRLNELKNLIVTVGPFGLPSIPLKNFDTTNNIVPLHMLTISDSVEAISLAAEEMLAQYLLQIVQLSVHEIVQRNSSKYQDIKNHCQFLIQQLSNYLLILTHMFQSGNYRKVNKSAMAIIKLKSFKLTDLEIETDKNYYDGFSLIQTNSDFLSLISTCPTLILQWFNILMLLNFEDHGQDGLWNRLIRPVQENLTTKNYGFLRRGSANKTKYSISLSLNSEMMKRGTLILLCDFICENLNDAEHMTWLIVENINEIIKWSHELPINEFINTIHRNSASSGLFIQAANARCDEKLKNASFVQRLLHCLDGVHATQSAALISFLVEKIISNPLLRSNYYIMNLAEELACERIKVMTTSFDGFPQEVVNQVSVHEIDKLITKIDGIKFKKLKLKLDQFKMYISDPTSPSQSHPLLDSLSIEKPPEASKEWFLKIFKKYCRSNFMGHSAAFILDKLNYDDIFGVISNSDFKLDLLADCIEFGQTKFGLTDSKISTNSMIPTVINRNILLKASLNTIIHHVNHFVALLPTPHFPFLPHSEMNTPKEAKHRDKIIDLFADLSFWNYLFSLSTGFSSFLNHYQDQQTLSSDLLKNIVRFSVLYAEAGQFMTEKNSIASTLKFASVLKIMNSTLKCKSTFTFLSASENITFQCTFIATLYSIVEYYYGKFAKLDDPSAFFGEPENPEWKHAQRACLRINQLIRFLEVNSKQHVKTHLIPSTISTQLQKVILATAQLPVVNSFILIPPLIWTSKNWNPNFSGDCGTFITTVPSEYLQDKEILNQFAFRIRKLGWSNRIQFEEIWMSLLGVLGSSSASTNANDEHSELVLINCVAVEIITELLLLSTLTPHPGNPIKSNFFKQKVEKPIPFLQTRVGEKLKVVRDPLQKGIENILNQMKVLSEDSNYGYCRLSISNLKSQLKPLSPLNESPSLSSDSSSSNHSPVSPIVLGFSPSFQTSKLEIDLTSCLHFLLDLYGQFLTAQPIHFPLITEITKSIVLLSDLFREKAQFSWMFDNFIELFNLSQTYENEVILQFIIIGICKSAAILELESEQIIEKTKKCVEVGLKSSYLPNRIATLYGLRYLLEYRGVGVNSKETVFLPIASEYLQKHLGDDLLPSSYNFDHVNQMWKLTFHLIENFIEDFSESEFGQKIFQLSLKILITKNSKIFSTVIEGLEQLLLFEKLTLKNANDLLKTAFERFKTSECHLVTLSSLKLIASTTYFIGGIGLDQGTGENEDYLVAMEKLTVIFDRLKSCYSFEGAYISRMLPNFFFEFFPTQDILNKCIGEFLSSKQSTAQHLAFILFQLFNNLLVQSRHDIVHEWVVLSQSSFFQITPLANAIWSLTVFLISASSNQWIRLTFPYVQSRLGVFESCDRELYCCVVANFYNELKSDENRESFRSTLQSVAEINTPYADALRCLSAK